MPTFFIYANAGSSMPFEKLERQNRAGAEEVTAACLAHCPCALSLFCAAQSSMMAPTNIFGESAMAAGLRVLLAAMWLLSGVAVSSAQGYPSKPVRVVVGFPGGRMTKFSRAFASATTS